MKKACVGSCIFAIFVLLLVPGWRVERMQHSRAFVFVSRHQYMRYVDVKYIQLRTFYAERRANKYTKILMRRQYTMMMMMVVVATAVAAAAAACTIKDNKTRLWLLREYNAKILYHTYTRVLGDKQTCIQSRNELMEPAPSPSPAPAPLNRVVVPNLLFSLYFSTTVSHCPIGKWMLYLLLLWMSAISLMAYKSPIALDTMGTFLSPSNRNFGLVG